MEITAEAAMMISCQMRPGVSDAFTSQSDPVCNERLDLSRRAADYQQLGIQSKSNY